MVVGKLCKITYILEDGARLSGDYDLPDIPRYTQIVSDRWPTGSVLFHLRKHGQELDRTVQGGAYYGYGNNDERD